MSEKREIKLIKRERSRSELTLLHEMVSADPEQVQMALAVKDSFLYEIVQRNPERAREFLRRLRESVKAAA